MNIILPITFLAILVILWIQDCKYMIDALLFRYSKMNGAITWLMNILILALLLYFIGDTCI